MLDVNGGAAIGSYAGNNAAGTGNLIVSGVVGIGSALPAASLDLSRKTDAIALPVGTTTQRPGGIDGMLRYNSTLNDFEGFINGMWTAIITSNGGLGTGVTLGTSAAVTNPQRINEINTGLFSDASGTVEVSSLGTEKLMINGTGVGVGTSVIANVLDVNGATSIGYMNTAAPSNGLLVSGNVGIGTTSTIQPLEVGGNAQVDGTLYITGATNINIGNNQINIGTSSSATELAFNYSGKANIPLDLYDGSGVSKIDFNPNGNSYFLGGAVGVGTATPESLLDVYGGEAKVGTQVRDYFALVRPSAVMSAP